MHIYTYIYIYIYLHLSICLSIYLSIIYFFILMERASNSPESGLCLKQIAL